MELNYLSIPKLQRLHRWSLGMFVVNFNALAQTSDFRIERRQFFFLCWMQGSKLKYQTPHRQQTECPLTNRRSYRGSSKNLNSAPVPMISEHSAYSTPLPVGFSSRLWWFTCSLLLIAMLWHRQAIFELKEDKLSSHVECRIRSQGLRHQIASRLNARWQWISNFMMNVITHLSRD